MHLFSTNFSEILTNAIRLNVYPIDFSIYSTCPRAVEQDAHDLTVSGATRLIDPK